MFFGIWDDGENLGRWKFVIEEFVCFGGFGWKWNIAEKDICCRELMVQERFQAEKVFFGLRVILGRGRCGSEKDVRAREIVVWWVQEACVEEVLLLCSFSFSMTGD